MSMTRKALAFLVLSCSLFASAEQLTFQQAIQLALTHSPQMGIAAADQQKAERAYQETKNAYLPNVTLGSGIGYSYGYPLSLEGSAPSIFNVNYQSSLYNPALREFIRSAKLEWNAAATNTADQRKDVILDTALTYIQLDKLLTASKDLRAQEADANRLADIVSQRVQQGVDSQAELTRSKLVAARVHMRIAEIEGNIDLLRDKLSKLTGTPAASLNTDSNSIPAFPPTDTESDLSTKALESSSAVKAAEQRAEAQAFRAKGEWRSLYPSFDLVGQYGFFSKFNNYEDFFKKFQRNNVTFGMAIKFPIFNYVQRAHAEQADAELIKTKKQAEAVKGQVSAETLKLQRSIRQLAAAEQVAQLDYELAKSEAQSTQIRAESGTAPPANSNETAASPATVTARDVASARIQATDKYSQYLDTSFELVKARLQLMRSVGEIEQWAGAAK